MPIHGRPPARLVLGVSPVGGATALVEDGRLLGVEPGDATAGWPASARRLLQSLGRAPEAIDQVAGPLSGKLPPVAQRILLARAARAALGAHAAFVGQGLVGTGLPRPFDSRDRVSLHAADRCRAAAAYYTAGERLVFILVEDAGRRSRWLGTSGKLLALGSGSADAAEAVALQGMAETGAPLALLAGVGAPGGDGANLRASALHGDEALAAGAALVARADERQGSWVPAAWQAHAPG